MEKPREQISKEQAREALLRSGYLLEYRLEGLLRRKGYYVDANASFPAPDTGKSRELDINATFPIQAGPKEFDFVWPVLIIECVNNPQPIGLMTKEPLVAFLNVEDFRIAGIPAKILVPRKGWRSIHEFLQMDEYHHYCRGRIATQFCSFTKRRTRTDGWHHTRILISTAL